MSLIAFASPVSNQAGEGVPEVEVAVLGPVEIRGTALPFSRMAAAELVVYLAFHRGGATNDVWGAGLWPDRNVASSTIHSTVSVARRALGRSADGSEHLKRVAGRLRLGPGVATDMDRFTRAASGEDPKGWRDALSLVRGRLFDGLCLSDWTVFDGTSAELESIVVTTALKASDHALHIGQGEEAEWMIRQALRVSPYDERLYRGLLRSTEAKGNRVGLRSTLDELRHRAAVGAGATIHPQTMALYRRLSRSHGPDTEGDLVRL